MLKQLTITNYRSCAHTSLDLSTNLSVLIGTNGSGKTNILNAIMLLKQLAEFSNPRGQRSGSVTSVIDARFDAQNCVIDLHADFVTFTTESNSDIVQGIKEEWRTATRDGLASLTIPLAVMAEQDTQSQMYAYFRRVGPDANKFFTEQPLEKVPKELKNRFPRIARFCQGMKYYSASQFTNPGTCGVSFEVGEDGQMTGGYRARQQGHTQILYDMYQASCESENSRYQRFMDIVGPDGLRLIDSLVFKKVLTSSSDTLVRVGGDIEKRKNKRFLVVPTITIGKRRLSPNQLSEGTFKTLVLLFHIMMTESTALLIEEPEVCIHHGLLSSVLELIKVHSREKIIILTTHSDFVLDQVEPENVHHVTFSRSKGTEVRHIPNSMTEQEYEALRKFLRTQGSLGEYWRAGALTETP